MTYTVLLPIRLEYETGLMLLLCQSQYNFKTGFKK